MSQIQRVRQLETCNREIFGTVVIKATRTTNLKETIQSIPVSFGMRRASTGSTMLKKSEEPSLSSTTSTVSLHPYDLAKRRASTLLHQLLVEIYNNYHGNGTDYNSTTSAKSHKSLLVDTENLYKKDIDELRSLINDFNLHIERTGNSLVRRLKRRDALRRQQDAHCDVITGQIQKRVPESSDSLQFSIQPTPGESGFQQWVAAMKMVAQLSGGIPIEFRRRLWLTLADRHLNNRHINWSLVEKNCFSEWSHPDDAELGVQIVKDLHRTGCSLFCGEDGQENQALLKRVLLAYARWNKAVGYCQGFNMLAALILQVTDKCETDALKLMIYLIEGVLPDSYFADSLRGLSVDMAVFRELLRTKLPKLSHHLDMLQNASKEGTTSYEPPLTNVFTMQWFLTLFCNCLPQPTVLRVWDLILLEGNEILLRTALAIWQTLAERIMTVHSADEFYCIMGVLTRELLESNLIDGNSLIKSVVTIGPLNELKNLREHYLYNINPWGSNVPPTIYPTNNKQIKIYPKERLILDINTLKKQYVKLKQRQRQAHIIFNAAISRQPPPNTPPVAMNHLLLGKSTLVPTKRLEPPKRTVSPTNQRIPSTLLWKDAPKHETNSSSSSDTELCDDPSDSSSTIDDVDNHETVYDNNDVNQKTPDNPSTNYEVNLMPDDNIVVDTTIIEHQQDVVDLKNNDNFLNDNQTNETSDIFDSAPSTSFATNYDLIKYDESDDDSVDFEKFLEDRVRCLKPIDLDDEQIEIEEDRSKCAQRSSARALQIIQENSLILHRILQCQSRLSPPIIDTTTTTTTAEETDESQTVPENDPVSPETVSDQSPEYGSKYKSILEKSRSLDEKYNTLILNSNVKTFSKTWNDLKEFKTDSNIPESSLETIESKSETTITDRLYDDQSDLRLKDLQLDLQNDNDSSTLVSSNFSKSPDDATNPRIDVANAKLSPKSPNRVFNPFPVTLSSRQNKEVPLKLGMYKK